MGSSLLRVIESKKLKGGIKSNNTEMTKKYRIKIKLHSFRKENIYVILISFFRFYEKILFKVQ